MSVTSRLCLACYPSSWVVDKGNIGVNCIGLKDCICNIDIGSKI